MTSVAPRALAGEIVEEVLGLLVPAVQGGLRFRKSPTYLVPRIVAIKDLRVQRLVVKDLAAVGYMLDKRQASPQASRELMRVVKAAIDKLAATGAAGRAKAAKKKR